jgi:hypothetical protein
MSKTKTKVGTLIQKIEKVLEGRGHYALAIQLVDGKIKVWRFSPGKPLKQVHEIGEDHVLLLDGNDAVGMLHPKGVTLETLENITHSVKDMKKVSALSNENEEEEEEEEEEKPE